MHIKLYFMYDSTKFTNFTQIMERPSSKVPLAIGVKAKLYLIRLFAFWYLITRAVSL